MYKLGLVAVAVLLAIAGCMAGFYRDSIHHNFQAIRGYKERFGFPEATLKVAERACFPRPDDFDTQAASRSCATARSAVLALVGIHLELRKLSAQTRFVARVQLVADAAAARGDINEKAWADAIDLNAQDEKTRQNYGPDVALKLVRGLGATCGVDERLNAAALSLLEASKSAPASYRTLAVELNALTEMSLNPHGSLSTYRQTMADIDQTLRRARLFAVAEPHPVPAGDQLSGATESAAVPVTTGQ